MLAEACRIVYDYSRAERNSTGSTSNPCTNNSLTSLCMGKEIQTDADWKTEKDRLNSEIIKLEASLIEAKEVTSVNLTEEISDEFTNKLREAKRERVRIEDEFEDATAQWRSERRRLNSEIDGLEQSVQKLRSDARHARASGGSGSEELRAEAEEATRLKETGRGGTGSGKAAMGHRKAGTRGKDLRPGNPDRRSARAVKQPDKSLRRDRVQAPGGDGSTDRNHSNRIDRGKGRGRKGMADRTGTPASGNLTAPQIGRNESGAANRRSESRGSQRGTRNPRPNRHPGSGRPRAAF